MKQVSRLPVISSSRGHSEESVTSNGQQRTRAHQYISRVLQAEILRHRRSPLIILHLACALIAGGGSGIYFAFSSWDASWGADAFIQLIGATLPFMVAIVCGVDADFDAEATRYSSILAQICRYKAFIARVVVLWVMGACTLALTIVLFVSCLAFSGKPQLDGIYYVAAVGSLSLGSLFLYVLFCVVALQWGRNVAVILGAVALLVTLLSVGGLAHGLMTKQLTASMNNVFTFVPITWPNLLGSLSIEQGIASMLPSYTVFQSEIQNMFIRTSLLCFGAVVILVGLSAEWLKKFEPHT